MSGHIFCAARFCMKKQFFLYRNTVVNTTLLLEAILMIGQRLKSLRRERGLRQEDLAEIFGVRKMAISNYEKDKNDPSDNIKVAIAQYFNVSLDYLLGIIDEPIPIYHPDIFLWLPNEMDKSEMKLLSEFINFVEHRRGNGG
jgi:transcriptional regulator with XRE-family HTH domain